MISNQMRAYRNYCKKLIIRDTIPEYADYSVWFVPFYNLLYLHVFSLFRGERKQDDKTKSLEDDKIQANRRN